MGQKVNPNGLRVGVIDDWSSHWYADKNTFSDCLVEDQKIREFVLKAVEPIARGNAKKPVDESRTNVAGVSKVIIDRKGTDRINVIVKTARPSLVGGDKGSGRIALKDALEKEFNKNVAKDKKRTFTVDIEVIKNSDTDALLVAQNIAAQLENRASFRRAMKRAMQMAMKQPGVLGIKTKCSVWAVPRSQDPRHITRARSRFRHSVLISITDLQRQRQHTVSSALKSGSTRVRYSARRASQRSLKEEKLNVTS